MGLDHCFAARRRTSFCTNLYACCSVPVMGVFLRFEDDSVESAKQVMQWNVKIINVREMSYIYSIACI